MKNLFFISFFFSLLLLTGCSKDDEKFIDIEKEIPDVTFRAYCLDSFDTNGDGSLSVGEIEAVTEFGIQGVENLKGIELFSSLEGLSVSQSPIKSIDLSGNKKLKILFFMG